MNEQDHKHLALWAADCAEHVLPFFENWHPDNDRPRKAIEAARGWVRGDLPMTEARKAAFAAHAAARESATPVAQFAARSAGHAAATAHVANHARHAAAYAIKAAAEINGDGAATEREWQVQQLSEHLRAVVFPTDFV